jgi:hypothetical protein
LQEISPVLDAKFEHLLGFIGVGLEARDLLVDEVD